MQDSDRQARMLIKQANAIGYIEPTQALPLLQSALAILDQYYHRAWFRPLEPAKP